MPTGTPTARPSATAAPSATPTRLLSPREQWLAAHEVERLRRVKRYGAARTLTALEYHGNSYTLNGGTIDMNPSEFARQMRRLQELDAHSVTFDELHGFLNGNLELPLGSIILTTDSGQKSYKSMPEMLEILAETGQHFQSFIWTKSMSPLESALCLNDACWEIFRKAHASGLVSLGTHSESHADFATLSAREGLAELLLSKEEIFDQTGVEVNSISWPFESIPTWAAELESIGIYSGFGGSTRPLKECYAEWGDAGQYRYRLPRLLPPNTNGISSRPNGWTLDDILSSFSLPL